MKASLRAAAAAAALALLAGCAQDQAQRQARGFQEARQQVAQIFEVCKQKRLSGELPGHVASADCSNDRARQVLLENDYPYMDLVDLWLAYRMDIAKRIDEGELSEEDAQSEFTEQVTRINNEAERRDSDR